MNPIEEAKRIIKNMQLDNASNWIAILMVNLYEQFVKKGRVHEEALRLACEMTKAYVNMTLEERKKRKDTGARRKGENGDGKEKLD